MLKRLAILGVLLACLPVYGQEKTSKPQSDQKNCEHVKQSAPDSSSVSIINSVNQQTAQGKRDDTDNQPDTYLHHLILPETLASIGLLIVGIIGTYIALGTLKNIERQTKSGETAANAAFQNAQAVINAERPWLLVVIKPMKGPMGGFNVHVRNKGRSPAMITAAYIGCTAVKEMSALPEKAPYSIGSLIQDRIIVPDGAVRITWFDAKMFENILKDSYPRFYGEKRIFVFGKVLYRDLANPDKSVIHETRWVGLYQPPVGDEGGNSIFHMQGIGVPDEYDRYT